MEGKVICHTCQGKEVQTFTAPDPWSLILAAESALLDNHVCIPHSASHDLRVHLSMSASDLAPGASGMKRPLRIECVRKKCPRERLMEIECEPWFVTACVLAFHASHEGHPLKIDYDHGRLSLASPVGLVRQVVPGAKVAPVRPVTQG